MTIRRAISFYTLATVFAVVFAWVLSFFVAWYVGMVIMTLVVLDHMRYTRKVIRRADQP